MGSDIHMNAQLPTLNPEKDSGHAVQLSRGWGRIRLPLTLTLSPKGRGKDLMLTSFSPTLCLKGEGKDI